MSIRAQPRSAASQASGPRRATNVSLSKSLLNEAKELDINISQACERGLAAALIEAKRQRWLVANREAVEAWNDYVEQHGLPLAEFRQF